LGVSLLVSAAAEGSVTVGKVSGSTPSVVSSARGRLFDDPDALYLSEYGSED